MKKEFAFSADEIAMIIGEYLIKKEYISNEPYQSIILLINPSNMNFRVTVEKH